VRVDVRGSDSTSTRTISLAAVDRIANLAAIPLVTAAQQISDARPGVVSAEEIFDPGDFLARVSDGGIRLARLEPERV
jgi:hypothetical protein